MNVTKIYEDVYGGYIGFVNGETKYEWAASEIFDLVTYDGSIDESFVKNIIEVCKVILEKKTYEYIKDEKNYITYLLVCQLLNHNNWINWGTSIRGAWFEACHHGRGKSEPIISEDFCGTEVPFTIQNLKLLIDFIELEEGEE